MKNDPKTKIKGVTFKKGNLIYPPLDEIMQSKNLEGYLIGRYFSGYSYEEVQHPDVYKVNIDINGDSENNPLITIDVLCREGDCQALVTSVVSSYIRVWCEKQGIRQPTIEMWWPDDHQRAIRITSSVSRKTKTGDTILFSHKRIVDLLEFLFILFGSKEFARVVSQVEEKHKELLGKFLDQQVSLIFV